MEEVNTDEPNKTDEKPIRDKRGLFVVGNPGSPGRPKGKGLKEYDRQRFADMSDEEKEEFLKQIAPDIRYRMAEGNPSNDDKLAAEIKIIIASESDEDETDEGSNSNSEGQSSV